MSEQLLERILDILQTEQSPEDRIQIVLPLLQQALTEQRTLLERKRYWQYLAWHAALG